MALCVGGGYGNEKWTLMIRKTIMVNIIKIPSPVNSIQMCLKPNSKKWVLDLYLIGHLRLYLEMHLKMKYHLVVYGQSPHDSKEPNICCFVGIA